ncbi:MAG TPA: tryptophan-rich sensory protein, partial [Tenericutes bacterium]|nr:tryptophan-rich sensory protein [Mycoplasmatota bacterium]
LIVVVIIMIKMFVEIDKKAGYLQIPYLLWLVFASILNLSIIILN